MSIEYCNTCKMFHPDEECAPPEKPKHWRDYSPEKVHVRKPKRDFNPAQFDADLAESDE